MDSFAALVAGAQACADGFALDVPPSWHQGRTAYGGFSGALALVAAMRARDEGLPPLRSATVSFIGPLHGQVRARAWVQRSGRNATWIAAEVHREGEGRQSDGIGELGLSASFVFMGPVASELVLNQELLPIGLIPVEDAAPIPGTGFTPECVKHHFDMRFAVPRAPEPHAEIVRWVRLRQGEGLDPMVAVMLLADSLPPGVLPLLKPGVRVSSMTWQVNLLTPQPATADGWWLLRSAGDFAEAGCSSQRMEIWNSDGRPIATGMQAVALFD